MPVLGIFGGVSHQRRSFFYLLFEPLWGRKPPKTKFLTAGSRTQRKGADARPRPNRRTLRSLSRHSRQGAEMPSEARQRSPRRGGRAQAKRARTQNSEHTNTRRKARRARAQRGAPAGATSEDEESEAGQPTARASEARPSRG